MTPGDDMDSSALGNLANTVPPEAWGKLADTASGIVRDLLAPLTATTSGIGRVIQARFDRLSEVEKINSAAVVEKAREKIEKSGRPMLREVNAPVVVLALEEAGMQTDPTLQELWSNLLAQEFTRGGVHPEIPRILTRLMAEDADLLATIANNPPSLTTDTGPFFPEETPESEKLSTMAKLFGEINELPKRRSLSYSLLAGLNLIEKDRVATVFAWILTPLGKAFIEAVTDPAMNTDEEEPQPPAESSTAKQDAERWRDAIDAHAAQRAALIARKLPATEDQ